MVNYTVKCSLQKMDELHICLDMVLRNKTPNKTNTIIPPLAGSLFQVCVSVFLSICPSKRLNRGPAQSRCPKWWTWTFPAFRHDAMKSEVIRCSCYSVMNEGKVWLWYYIYIWNGSVLEFRGSMWSKHQSSALTIRNEWYFISTEASLSLFYYHPQLQPRLGFPFSMTN